MKKNILLSLLAIIISLGFIVPAHAVTLTYDTIAELSGIRYNFILDNNDQPSIFELFLQIPAPDANLLSFSSPAGWGDGFGVSEPFHGDAATGSFSQWFADSGAELPQGNTLPGFSFTIAQPLSDSDPIFFSFNQDAAFSQPAQRSVPASAPVPEPATILLLGPALFGLVVYKKTTGGRR